MAGACVGILLDVGKECSDWLPPLKSALGGVSAVIKHYEVGHPVPMLPVTDSLLAIQRCQGEGQANCPVAGEAERYPRNNYG